MDEFFKKSLGLYVLKDMLPEQIGGNLQIRSAWF